MRFRLGWAAAFASAFGGVVFACGNSSFTSDTEDGGGSNDAGTDVTSTTDSPSGFDGSTGGDANEQPDAVAADSGSDAGRECDAGPIVDSTNQIACPLDDTMVVNNCTDPGKGQECCVTAGNTVCQAQAATCAGGAALECESEKNCGSTNNTCCATLTDPDAGPAFDACPPNVTISGADCAGCDLNTQVRLCSGDLACAGISGETCVPMQVTVGTNTNPITLGVCK